MAIQVSTTQLSSKKMVSLPVQHSVGKTIQSKLFLHAEN